MIAVVAAAAIVATYPVNVLLSRYGIRCVLTLIGLLSATATALIPLAASTGLAFFIVCRIAQGIAFVACYTVIGGIVSAWAPLTQHGLFVSILCCFKQFAPSITNPLSGALCTSSLGWHAVYYVHAGMTLIVFIVFFIVYRNSPHKHPCVSNTELLIINANKISTNKQQRRSIPYLAILRTPVIWCIWLAAFGDFINSNVVLLYSPVFLNRVIRFPVDETGITSALPPALQLVVKISTGYFSDRCGCIGSERLRTRLFNTIGLVGSGICFLILATFFTSSATPQLALTFLICAEVMLGFDVAGFYKSATLVSRHYSQFVLSIVSMIFNICMLIVPFIVAGIASNNAPNEWRIIFYIVAGACILTAICFALFANPTPAKWTMTTDAIQPMESIQTVQKIVSPTPIIMISMHT